MALLLLLIPVQTKAQRKQKNRNKQATERLAQKPKLIVGIVVDQMRYDYLTRFWNHYGDGGFKRLVSEGFNCKNNHFNYAPTSTGPGHASVYTGTTPATHGVIGNNWYDKKADEVVYCVSDANYTSVGTTSDAGKMSPHRMLTTTFADQVRLDTQMRGKVIAIALKDRGAVLPGGHTANHAFWFEAADKGHWISSSFYGENLPKWVQDFNASDAVERYKKTWNTLKPIAEYVESGTDVNTYEGKLEGETTTAFPHDLPSLWEANGKYGILRVTPFGNSMTTDFALEALKQEKLGKDADTDVLAISYSSTDYVGHFYGVNSKEVQDTYLRLDQDIARILSALDSNVGVGKYTVFLTADHGAVQVPAYLQDQKIPAGYLDSYSEKAEFQEFLKYTYGTTDVVKNSSNSQVFLDYDILKNLDIDLATTQKEIAKQLLSYDHIDRVYTGTQMWENEYTRGVPYILQQGWHPKRSGDVLIVPEPGYIRYSKTGSTHGSAIIYDTHVPLLFYGSGIKKGETLERTEIPDIAPTISALLGIAFPNGSSGTVLTDVIR